MDVHLRRLRAFVVVAEELHFTRAASRLFVAQQALSKQISDLEAELGTALFERTSRRVELTPAGEAFLAAARDVLSRFDQGVGDARRIGAGAATLRLGFIVGAALELTPHILSEFTHRHPDVQLELHEFGLSDPSAGLRSGVTDVAFLRRPAATDDLVTITLFHEPCVVGVNLAHRLAGRSSLRVADLAGEPIAIGHTDDRAWRDFWTLADDPRGGRARPLVETSSQSEEMEVVAAGMACAVTPAAAIRYSPHPGIRFIPIDDHPPSTVEVAHRAGALPPAVAAFVDVATMVRDRERTTVRAIERPFG